MWDMGYTEVNLQVDSKLAIIFLLRSIGATDFWHQACIEGLRNLINHDWTVKITHTYR
ncbi:hypothetical protein LINGRAHAP2_LOCUS36145 [Linum grandiflorum]